MSLPQEDFLAPFTAEALPCKDGPYLVLAPHADDESIGMGGTLAKAARAGIALHVAVMTDGAQGGSVENLVKRRQQEVKAAADSLGVRYLHFLEQPDRGLSVSETSIKRITQLIEEIQPAAVFFPGVQELHPDHRATALIAWRALQLQTRGKPQAFAYEITVQSPLNCLVDISAEMIDKERAIRCYESQLGEKPYIELVKALNKLRTLTLPATVQWAEGYYRFTESELGSSLQEWLQQRGAASLQAS